MAQAAISEPLRAGLTSPPEPNRALQHVDADKKDDEVLRQEARAHLAAHPERQLLAELIARLRSLSLPWWTPAALRQCWSAADRMRWFNDRPDLRQHVTSQLSGLSAKMARRIPGDIQAALIDSVIDESDVSVRRFEEAFEPADLVVYGPAHEFWRQFRERMPWQDDLPVHRELVAWLLKALLTERSSADGGRRSLLAALELRSAIDTKVWHTRLPLEIRAAIDELRIRQERAKPDVPASIGCDLTVATPEVLAANIPLVELVSVMTAAEKAMGFDVVLPRAPVRLDAPRAVPKASSGAGKASPSTPPPPSIGPRASVAPTPPLPRPAATANGKSTPLPPQAPKGSAAGPMEDEWPTADWDPREDRGSRRRRNKHA